MICGDAGSPRVLRFGEKGMVWLTLEAAGRAAHGAHVHLGESAIERLTDAMARLTRLRALKVDTPAAVARAVAAAKSVSEPLSGPGESTVLTSVTVNFGKISGGRATNLVADRAHATADIRLPAGVSRERICTEIADLIGGLPGLSYRVEHSCEATWSDPDHEIFVLAAANASAALGVPPVVNMRVGGSDARLYRERAVPSLVCGLTPHNMGAADEYVTLEELSALGEIHTMTAFDFLARPS